MTGDPKRYRVRRGVGCGSPNESKAGTEPLLNPNPEKAKAMLQAAGALGAKIALMDQTDNDVHRAVLVAAQSLRRMGFAVDVVAMDWSTLLQRRASKALPAQGGWNVFLTNATGTGIANPLIHNFVKNCEQAWYGWACDQRRRSRPPVGARSDPAKQKQLIDDLQRAHLDNVSYVPLGMYQPTIIYRKELSGIIPAPAIFYWNIKRS
jgi:peptide/nickel transport system substrate-binding protein